MARKITLGNADKVLGDLLLRHKLVNASGLERATRESKSRGISIRDALIGLNLCLEDQINWAISRERKIPFVLLTAEMVDRELLGNFPAELLTEVRAIPIHDASGGVTLVMTDPLDESAFQKVVDHLKTTGSPYAKEVKCGIGPTGRVQAMLEKLAPTPRETVSSLTETIHKDTSGVAASYGMLVEARRRNAQRILIRPSGDGIEAVFRLERGWVIYRNWPKEQALSIWTRCRVMAGLPSDSTSARESASTTIRVAGERLFVEFDFLCEDTGNSLAIGLYPLLPVQNLENMPDLLETHRQSLIDVVQGSRPTGIIVINSADERQRYRMTFALLSHLAARRFDIVSIENHRYYEPTGFRRFEMPDREDLWSEWRNYKVDVLAIPEAPIRLWKNFVDASGDKLIIAGLDFSTSKLVFSSIMEISGGGTVVADRLRCIWSAKRVDQVCTVCNGKVQARRGMGDTTLCPACDGYGNSKGEDLFEVVYPDDEFRVGLISGLGWDAILQSLMKVTVKPSIDEQFQAGLQAGRLFNSQSG
jgi:hypothetical protein